MPSDDFSGMDNATHAIGAEGVKTFANRSAEVRNSTGIESTARGEKTAPSQVQTPTGISNPSEVSISTELSTPSETLNPDEVSTPSSTKLTPSQVSTLTKVSTPRGKQTTTMARDPALGKHRYSFILFFWIGVFRTIIIKYW